MLRVGIQYTYCCMLKLVLYRTEYAEETTNRINYGYNSCIWLVRYNSTRTHK